MSHSPSTSSANHDEGSVHENCDKSRFPSPSITTSPSGNPKRTRDHEGGLSPDSETNPHAIVKHTMHLGDGSDAGSSHSHAAAIANNQLQHQQQQHQQQQHQQQQHQQQQHQQHQQHQQQQQQQQRGAMLANAPDSTGASTVPRWVNQQEQRQSPHHQLQRQIIRNKLYNDASIIPPQNPGAMNPHEPVNNLSALHGGMPQDTPSALNYGGRRQQQLLGQHPQQGAYMMRQNSNAESLGPGTEGNTGVVNATAKYRAAGIVAAAARAERDYHLATLHLQTKLAEAAERRALTNLSASMRAPMKDDFEVAQACLNLRTDSKDGVYPHMLDPNYARLTDTAQRRNRSDVPSSMAGNSMMHNASYPGHHRYLNPNNPQSLSLMDAHMHPLQNVPLESIPRDMHPNGPMPGTMHFMPEYHSSGPGGKRKHAHSPTEGEYTKKMKSAFQGSESSSLTVKTQDNKKGKRPADMPRRPLSAYNFFFSEERERVLASLPDPENKDEPKKKSDPEDKGKDEKGDGATDKQSAPEGGDNAEKVTTKNPQSNQDRLLSLRLVQHNVRRPHRKTHGKIGFKALAKLIGERWRALTAEKKEPYRKLAETDLARYKEQMEEYNRKNKWAFLQESEHQPPPGK